MTRIVRGPPVRLPSAAISVLLLVSFAGAGVAASAATQVAGGSCTPGPALLLVQTPAENFYREGYEDGLRVVDSCGADVGTIDVPNPAVVAPTARSNVAVVHTGPLPGGARGATYLVDAVDLIATELPLPAFEARDAWNGSFNLNAHVGRSARYTLVGTTDPDAHVYLLNLATAEVTDVLAALSADKILGQELDYGWVDPTDDAVYLVWGNDVIRAPIPDLGQAARVELDDPDATVESTPDSIDGIAGFEPQLIRPTWSTSWGATPFAFPAYSYDGLYASDDALRWLLFADPDPNDVALDVDLVADLASLSVVDATTGTARPIDGLHGGRGVLTLYGAVGGAPVALALWTPWTEENGTLFSGVDFIAVAPIVTASELYVVDLASATATRLMASCAAALSPDGGWVATTRIGSERPAGTLSVGPVGGPLVEVGLGFGTWLTP